MTSDCANGDVIIHRNQSGYVLESKLEVPRPLEEVFDFFSDARNLQVITPPHLSFQIVNAGPIEMREGTQIDYRIRLRGIPLVWRSEIAVWEPPHRFVDNQLKGPYRRWYHEHRFTAVEHGTLCEDRVEYSVLGGALVHELLVRRDVTAIFRYRTDKLRELFSS